MHELSIAMSLLDVITEQLIRENAPTARSVTIEVGDLSGVVPQALQTAFTTATRGTELAGCQLLIVRVPVTVWCDHCNAEQPAQAANDLSCRACGSICPRVVSGRELDVVRIDLSDPT